MTTLSQDVHYLNPLTATHQVGPYLARCSGSFRRWGHWQIHNRVTMQLWAPATSEMALIKSYPMASPLPGNPGHEKAKRLWAQVTTLEMRVMRQVLVYIAPF